MLKLPNFSIISQYARAGSIPLEEGMERILLATDKGFPYQEIFGTAVKCGGNRLLTYVRKGVVCIRCFKKGSYFAIERNKHIHALRYHLNLWGIDNNGRHFLMTSDHIIPKCKGGSGATKNRQPMCTKCNSFKGNLTMEQLAQRDRIWKLQKRGVLYETNFLQLNGAV